MATVTSLTKAKIEELLSGWADIDLSQQEILALIGQLYIATQGHDAALTEFRESDLPALQETLDANADRLSELNDSVLPGLQETLDAASADLQNLNLVDIPSIRQDLDAEITNGIDRPKVYVQDDPPEDPDDDARNLVVGDQWFESDNNNLQHFWTGAEWSTMAVDIPDLSLTVKKFKTSTHMIY